MPGITIADLDNAKTDVDHIADIATSPLTTATDRFGRTKDTIAGALYKITGITPRGAWASATVYGTRDIVLTGGTWYVCVVAHTSSTLFATDAASKWRVYQGVTAGDLLAFDGAAGVGYLANLPNAVLGTVADRFYVIDAVADYGADPTFANDSTSQLDDFLTDLPDYCVAVIPPGEYQYNAHRASGTGVGYLNFLNKIGVTLIGYGAVVREGSSITTAPFTADMRYGFKFQGNTDCRVIGLTFDGNRDKTFGTNVDGNEFYSGFYLRNNLRMDLIDCSGINCQGDGLSCDRSATTTGFNYFCSVRGGYFAGNRRNEISMGGDFGFFIGDGVRLVGSSDAHRTNPKSGIDLEWEHATIGPTGNNTYSLIDGVNMSGTMPGGGIAITRWAGVTIDHLVTSGIVTSINIDSTASPNYETQNINIGAGCQLTSTYGVAISGGTGIRMIGGTVRASYPFIINSALGAAPYGWVADISSVHIVGESVFAISALDGKTRFVNNLCDNCSGGGGFNYMALFRNPSCEVRGNTFTRDTNQSAPGYGVVISESSTIFEDNTIQSATTITHPVSFGESSTPAYPKMRQNYYNGAALPDLLSTWNVASPVHDSNSSDPQICYTPFFRDNSEITAWLMTVAKAGVNTTPTTTMKIGVASDDDAYMTARVMDVWALGSVIDITADMLSLNTAYADPVFVTYTPGTNVPHLQHMITLQTNRASLYTSSHTFT